MNITVRKLEWDDFNSHHIAKHGVTILEVEEACLGEHVTQETYNHRILLIGVTKTGRSMSVVLADKTEGVWYPITARPASRKERQYYQDQLVQEAA